MHERAGALLCLSGERCAGPRARAAAAVLDKERCGDRASRLRRPYEKSQKAPDFGPALATRVYPDRRHAQFVCRIAGSRPATRRGEATMALKTGTNGDEAITGTV